MSRQIKGSGLYPPLEDFESEEEEGGGWRDDPALAQIQVGLYQLREEIKGVSQALMWFGEFVEVLTPKPRYKRGLEEMKRRAEAAQAKAEEQPVQKVTEIEKRVASLVTDLSGIAQQLTNLPTLIMERLQSPPKNVEVGGDHPTLKPSETGDSPPDDLG